MRLSTCAHNYCSSIMYFDNCACSDCPCLSTCAHNYCPRIIYSNNCAHDNEFLDDNAGIMTLGGVDQRIHSKKTISYAKMDTKNSGRINELHAVSCFAFNYLRYLF
jgi:hypothetical protein